jgi:hypothetical protein
VPADAHLGFHPDDTTPIPRPSRYYGRRQDLVTRDRAQGRRKLEVRPSAGTSVIVPASPGLVPGQRMIESGPIPAVHGVVRWRLIDLAQWIFEERRSAVWARRWCSKAYSGATTAWSINSPSAAFRALRTWSG